MSWYEPLMFWRGATPQLPPEEVQERGEVSSEQALQVSQEAQRQADAAMRSIGGPDILVRTISAGSYNPPWNLQSYIRDGLRKASWVYICVSIRSAALARVPMVAGVNKGDDWERLPSTHPLQQLLRKPNQYQTWRDLVRLWTAYYLLSGEGHIGLNRGGPGSTAAPFELWPLSPAYLSPVPRKRADGTQMRGILSHYDWSIGGRKVQTLLPEDVISVIDADPEHILRGISRLSAGAPSVDVDAESVRWQREQMSNSAVPSGYVKDQRVLNAQQYAQEKKKVADRHTGEGNHRNVMFLDGARDFVPLSLTPVELDLINSRRFTREEICALFQVPPPVAGLYENATYSNAREAYKLFWTVTVAPDADRLADALTNGLADDYGGDIEIRPDFSRIPILSGLDEATVKAAQGLHSIGVPVQEINRRLRMGLVQYEGWDVSYPPKRDEKGAEESKGDAA